jgi:hypothetical protein
MMTIDAYFDDDRRWEENDKLHILVLRLGQYTSWTPGILFERASYQFDMLISLYQSVGYKARRRH